MKAKPICVIYIPESFSIGMRNCSSAANELMTALNGWGDEIDKSLRDKKLDEYIWFSFVKPDISTPEFKVFYEKDFTEIQYQELKQLIEDSLKQQPCNTN
jgi:hypothetical protein